MKNRSRWLVRISVTALFSLVLLQRLPRFDAHPNSNPWRISMGEPPLIIAHGGGQGLHPANTLPAFECSATSGCDVIEFDLRLTQDRSLVTLNDATPDPPRCRWLNDRSSRSHATRDWQAHSRRSHSLSFPNASWSCGPRTISFSRAWSAGTCRGTSALLPCGRAHFTALRSTR